MKRLLAILMTALLALSLAACGGNEANNGADVSNTANSSEAQESVKSSLELLTTVWDSYEEADKFATTGGDMSEENMTTDAPGKYAVDDGEMLDSSLGFPASAVDKIDDAASLMHMMNANTFTCGAFHVKEGQDVDEVIAAIKDNIMQRQWICGMPDKLVIVKADSYIVSFFGEKEIVETFKRKLTEAYPSAETVCDEMITE